MAKRAVDLALAAGAVIVLAPLLLLIALAIKLDSAGPVLYSQLRVGRQGWPFRLHKFRSMLADPDRRGPPLTRRDDPRVTRLGRVLRPLRLDELPQLFNVLRGDMSLVGPRPEVPSIVARYTSAERQVLSVRPGLVGPTHLAWLDEAERYPEGIDPVEYYVAHMLPEKLRSDLEYLRTRSLLTDLWCLTRVPAALLGNALRRRRIEPLARKTARLTLDLLSVCVATLLAFLLRFDWRVPDPELPYLLYGFPVAGAAYAVAFLALGMHRKVWRHFTLEDLWHVCGAGLLGGGLHALTVVLLGWQSYPRSVLVLTGLLTIVLLPATRLVLRSTSRRGAAPQTPSARRRA
jgi:lipopolysaccharide/colanic/teichoic acid biosynthesis glycosyltransferase